MQQSPGGSAAAAPSLGDVKAALSRSHDRLAATLTSLTDEQLSAQSYDDEWTIAQVASHLGSGAEVFDLIVDAGLKQADAPGIDQFQPIWDRWNAKTADEQAADAIAVDRAFADRIDSLTPDEASSWRFNVFGAERTLDGLLRMRVSEHAVHTWDIAVALDPGATIAEDAAGLVIDNLASLIERVGRPVVEPVVVDIRTSGPDRHLRLDLTSAGARLGLAETGGSHPPTAYLQLPAEAFVRLAYGRLDPDHTPASVRVDDIDLDVLRRTFPGV